MVKAAYHAENDADLVVAIAGVPREEPIEQADMETLDASFYMALNEDNINTLCCTKSGEQDLPVTITLMRADTGTYDSDCEIFAGPQPPRNPWRP